MATPNAALVRTYARNVFLYGTYELHDNKGPLVPDVNVDYVNAVMQNGRDLCSVAQLTLALASNYITQDEFEAVMALTPNGTPIY